MKKRTPPLATTQPSNRPAAPEPVREKSSRPSPAQQAINVLLPIAVVSLFLWWFCKIPPPVPPPMLPDGWTPGCPEWAGAWQSLPPQIKGDDVTLLDLNVAEDRLLWIMKANGKRLLQHVRLSDSTLIASADTSRVLSLDTTRHIAQFEKGTDAVPEVRLLDRDTLQDIGVQRFRSDAWSIPPGWTAFTSLIAMPDDTWSGVLVYVPKSEVHKERHDYWFSATADGRITQYRRIDRVASYWVPEPRIAPKSLVAWVREGDQAKPAIAIDLATGLEITDNDPPLPGAEAASPEVRSLLDRRLSPIPIGRRVWDGPRIDTLHLPRLEAELSILQPFFPDSTPPNSPWQRHLSTAFAEARHGAWTLTHSAPELIHQTAKSLQVDGVTLHRGVESSTGSIAVTGELRDSIEYEIRAGYQTHFAIDTPYKLALFEQQQYRILTLNHRDCETSLRALPDGSYLLMQVLRMAPEASGESAGILRIGRLSADASDMQWLGYISLKSLSDSDQVNFDAENVQIEIAGDRLFLAASYNGQKLMLQRPIPKYCAWITLPLPPELADLPEGLLK